MLRNPLVPLALALALSAPSIVDAQPRRRQVDRWSWIGVVGTHAHDAEDYIPVATNERYARLELRAYGRPIGIDRLRVKFADGRVFDTPARAMLEAGQRMLVAIPSRSPVEMIIVEYATRGPYWRDRETSRLEVRGLAVDAFRRGRDDRRYDDRRYDDRGYDDRDRDDRVDEDRRVVPAPRR